MKTTLILVLVVLFVDVYCLPCDNDQAVIQRTKRTSPSECIRLGRGFYCSDSYSDCEVVRDGVFCEGGDGTACMTTPYGSTCGPKCGCFKNKGCFCGDQCSCDTRGCQCGYV